MVQAVIFDMDGVIVDTELIQSQAFERILGEYGIVPKRNEHGTVHISGATTPETWEYLKKVHGFEANTEELTRKKRDAVIEVMRNGFSPSPGVLELLQDLQKHAVPLAIATSAQPERANLVINKLGINQYFNVVVTAQDVRRSKPEPDVYLAAAEQLGVTPKHCVVIEDAEVGVAAGKAAGMKVIAVPGEFTKKMDFRLADKRVESLNELDYNIIASL